MSGQASRVRLSRHCDGDEARGVVRGLALEAEGLLAEVNIKASGQCLKESRVLCG